MYSSRHHSLPCWELGQRCIIYVRDVALILSLLSTSSHSLKANPISISFFFTSVSLLVTRWRDRYVKLPSFNASQLQIIQVDNEEIPTRAREWISEATTTELICPVHTLIHYRFLASSDRYDDVFIEYVGRSVIKKRRKKNHRLTTKVQFISARISSQSVKYLIDSFSSWIDVLCKPLEHHWRIAMNKIGSGINVYRKCGRG